ncbi:hypothetical protein DENIS_3323 [Desulfonema ishimotonii]|uniref:histidine kinase n=1 Tax=Desulfonema ishimotonii TaxID=45657 RepID=A0A401FZE6_9BACT|nr:ABC transporter substrate-binding protein [Desulfonema ishimotonii]GBC62351.1 hypothetical protein DENIS_3323 [Desulfonema ishimotonii]
MNALRRIGPASVRNFTASLLIGFLILSPPAIFAADTVSLQLRWDHQFQFAGYYAAQWEGYYAEAGLNAEIRSAVQSDGEILSAVREVARGRADFGVGAADILIARDRGMPLMVLAVIFQQSAAEFYALRNTQMNTPADLLNLRVARRVNDLIDVELQAMLRAEGIDLNWLSAYPHQPGITHLADGRVDVVPGYRISVPYDARKQGMHLKVLRPADYGVDFYGDSLFCSRKLIEREADRVHRFVRASLKGWEYALRHPREIADRITREMPRLTPVDDFGAFNRFQAEGVRQLTLWPIVEVGHINPHRWHNMHRELKQSGVVSGDFNPGALIFDPDPDEQPRARFLRKALFIGVASVFLVFSLSLIWIRALRRTVAARTGELRRRIEAQRETEKALRDSEARYRNLFTHNHAVMLLTDTETGDIIDANPAACAFYGYPPGEMKKMNISAISQGSVMEFEAEIRQRSKKHHRYLLSAHRLASGEIRNVEIYRGLVDVGRQRLRHAIIHDISGKVATETALKKSERMFREIFDQSFQFIAMLSVEGRLLMANRNAIDFIHADESLLNGKFFWETPWWNNAEKEKKRVEKAIRGAAQGDVIRFETHHRTPDGVVHFFDVSIKPVKDDAGSVTMLIAEGRDISDIRQANAELRFNEARLTALLALNRMVGDSVEKITKFALDQAVQLTHSEMGYLAFVSENETALTMHSWSDAAVDRCRVKEFQKIYPVEKIGLWGEALRQRRPVVTNDYAAPNPMKKGCPEGHVPIIRHANIPVSDGERIVAVAGIANKTTPYDDSDIRQLTLLMQGMWRLIQRKRADKERIKLESQLRQARKMEAIGTLAGGIAHDFNNILFPIMGYAEMSMDDVPEGSTVWNNVRQVMHAAQRAQELVRQILAFSRQAEAEKKPARIHPIIREALRLIRASLPSTIDIQQDIPEEAGHVIADPVQIHQVIINLCTNAYHAMRETGGTLAIALKNETVRSEESFRKMLIMPGPYVRITISDTGCGMSRSVQEKIFEPYFTTKVQGEGSGLGLSIVHGIVKSHNGHITVYSEPERGTTFNIYLPRTDAEKASRKAVSARPVPRGTEHILLVDDEPQIVKMEKQLLCSLGYKVTDCTASPEALAAFTARPDAFDLVITDYTMPNMTGEELTRKLMVIRPDIPVILFTGFSELINGQKARDIGIREMIMKPVIRRDIAEAIRRVLDGENGNPA